MSQKDEVKKVLREITPYGLFDVAEMFGLEVHYRGSGRDALPLDDHEAEYADHDSIDRERLIAELEGGPTDWECLAEYLGLEG